MVIELPRVRDEVVGEEEVAEKGLWGKEERAAPLYLDTSPSRARSRERERTQNGNWPPRTGTNQKKSNSKLFYQSIYI